MLLKKIVIAEDDDAIAHMVSMALGDAGFLCLRARDGEEALKLVKAHDPDLLVLDVMMPRVDGLEVARRLKADVMWSRTPILMLTALAGTKDKVYGLDAGADDYLTKPFQADELVLRLRALIRRSHGHASPRLHCGPLQLDVNAGRFELDGQALSLSPQEFRLLSYFIHHSGQVIGRDRLGEQVFDGGHDPDSNALDVLLGRVRRKLGIDLIQTLRGQGWRLAAP
ncbi:response regulator transcription factor [Stenotrophomonas sp.]|uniref:response regulator transcription factor n=1 Tax=Stenotrophomonas sp. TaxID=69392 RepID=UPI00374CC6B3